MSSAFDEIVKQAACIRRQKVADSSMDARVNQAINNFSNATINNSRVRQIYGDQPLVRKPYYAVNKSWYAPFTSFADRVGRTLSGALGWGTQRLFFRPFGMHDPKATQAYWNDMTSLSYHNRPGLSEYMSQRGDQAKLKYMLGKIDKPTLDKELAYYTPWENRHLYDKTWGNRARSLMGLGWVGAYDLAPWFLPSGVGQAGKLLSTGGRAATWANRATRAAGGMEKGLNAAQGVMYAGASPITAADLVARRLHPGYRSFAQQRLSGPLPQIGAAVLGERFLPWDWTLSKVPGTVERYDYSQQNLLSDVIQKGYNGQQGAWKSYAGQGL